MAMSYKPRSLQQQLEFSHNKFWIQLRKICAWIVDHYFSLGKTRARNWKAARLAELSSLLGYTLGRMKEIPRSVDNLKGNKT